MSVDTGDGTTIDTGDGTTIDTGDGITVEATKSSSRGERLKAHATRRGVLILRTYGIVIALGLIMLFFSVDTSTFLTKGNLLSVAGQWAPQGIMAIGLTFVVLTGGFDLSFVAVFTLSSVTAAALGDK